MNLREAPRRLATTRWSMIARAVAPSQDQQQALGELCRLYWFPLYSFARRAGHLPEDAADLTQEFLAGFLERRDLEKTSPERGRFRSYLLQAMRNFLANEWRKQRAQKRGAGELPIEIDVPAAEARYAADPGAAAAGAAGGRADLADLADPARLYLRSFAMTAVAHALRALEDECREAGHHALFVALQPALVGELEAGELERLAPPLGRSPGAVKVAHRGVVDVAAAAPHDEIRTFLAAL
jgi:RNA polymerase sigma-70 factor (ECF subfamily)